MAIKINFDTAHNPESPTFILSKRNGDKIGQIDAKEIELSDILNDASEVSFNVYKYIDNKKCEIWDDIVDFKLIHCIEWNMWFEITVKLDELNEIVKTVFCTQLGQAELSQIKLYDVEINTENDIARDEYEIPTVLYNESHPEASLLHRIMEKAPHYKIIHVDDTIKNIQRTFTFSDISIYDAFQDISQEINCLFVLHSNSDENGNIQRTISVYDLESNCNECGYRGEFIDICPKCGSNDINEGYGKDTKIFITSDELGEEIQLSNDTDSVKNCFKLVAGDDLMTATIRNCNSNGTDYIWYISDEEKSDMSIELVEKINSYDNLFSYYQNEYNVDLDGKLIEEYNNLVRKYKVYNNELNDIKFPIIGYSNLMNAYYNTIDLSIFLQSSLMPSPEISETSAQEEANKLTTSSLSPVSATSIKNISLATTDNIILSIAKIIVNPRYRVKISSSELETGESYHTWTGNFTITNYYNEEDTAVSDTISVIVNDDYSNFIQQKLSKSLKNSDTEDLSISGLFTKSYDDFVNELKKYSLNCLTSFHDACQSCIDILIEQGIGDNETWSGEDPNLYNDLYYPYVQKLSAIESEIKIREEEIQLIVGVYDVNNELKIYGLQNYIEEIRSNIHKELDFQNYFGNDLWLEFCSYRREDKYQNNNYISDGLNNAELFINANEFIQTAQKEIRKSYEYRHSISTTLKNLLAIKKFKALVNDFQVGNWMRIMIDEQIYRIRLVKYSIKYDGDSFNNIQVDFSDVVKDRSTTKSVKDVINQASSMATSYNSVQRQAKKGEQSNIVLNSWIDNGLDTTNTKIIGGSGNQVQTWDDHGMLFKRYNSETDSYDDIQLKIINSTIAITDDNWNSTKTAIGNFYYRDPKTNELKNAYGINGEVIIGKLMIGEGLGIYNQSGSLTFDNNGFVVTNGTNTVIINPNNSSVFNIKNSEGNVLSFNEDGDLVIIGNITAKSLTLLGDAVVDSGSIKGLADVAISGSYNDLKDTPIIDLSGKFDNPTNNNSATVGQYLSKQSNGSVWKSAETSITSSGTLPVCGKAVYDFALNKNQGTDNAGKILYIDTTGNVTSISINELKTLLG